MPKALRFGGVLILHTIVTLLGTAVLETAIGKVFRPHSLEGVLWKEWILSLLCAGFIGFFMWRTWRVAAAMWVWVLPGVWFGLRFVLALFASHSPNLLVGGGVWGQFSGAACEGGLRALGCRNFFVFTIPFIRGVAYSVGARLSSWVNKPASALLSGQDQRTS
jgi:hypothetical protein